MQSRRSFLIVAFLLTLAPMASARQLGQTPAERAALVRDAFASAYGQALTAEFGKSLRENAYPSCLKDKGLEAGQLEARGRDLLIKWGTNFSEGVAALSDMKIYADLFTATAELDRLKQNADVKRYLAISAPAQQAIVLDHIFEHFERYVLIRRIGLTAVHPIRTGDKELPSKNPTDATQEAAAKFVASRRSAALDRFLDLSDQNAEAFAASMRKDQAIALGGGWQLFKGVETDLAELCIGPR